MENFVVNNSANTTENNTNENIFENTIGSAKANVFALPTFDLQLFDGEDTEAAIWSASSDAATVTGLTSLAEAIDCNTSAITITLASDVAITDTLIVGSGMKTIDFNGKNLTASGNMFKLDSAGDAADGIKTDSA